MKREETLTAIYTQFDRSANAFCEATNGIFCEIDGQYKRGEVPEELVLRSAKIYYSVFVAEFRYTPHGVMGVTNSILDCLIYLDKTDEAIALPLPFVANFCGVDTSAPLYIPLISNPAGMRQAFSCIGSVLEGLLNTLVVIACDAEKKAALLQHVGKEFQRIFESTDETMFELNEFHYKFLTLRFSSAPFLNFLKGNRAKAIKQLKKTKNPTDYETRLLTLWSSEEACELPDLSAIVQNAKAHSDSGVGKTDLKEFFTVFLSWILLCPVISAVYLTIYFLFMCIEGRGSIYLMGPIYNFPFCILAGFITAIAVSYFTRFTFYKWIYKKDYEIMCERDAIQNNGGSDRLMKGFLRILILLSLALCVLLCKWNLNFLSDGFVDNTKFFSLRGEYHSYSQVERIYYKADRVNGLGETLDFPSYVLVLKNGKEIDFYEYDETERCEERLLDQLREKGIPVEDPVK